MDRLNEISQAFGRHYSHKIREHGPSARGLDWGAEKDVTLRYGKMLEVVRPQDRVLTPSLLDVGCGYGGLLGYANDENFACEYTGLDLVEETIAHARALYPRHRFIVADILDWDCADEQYDYVVCSGILTLKLAASILDMNRYFASVLRKMFALSRKGIAFNVMTNCVNFTAENLYYRSPVEVLAFCLAELSTRVRLDQSYPLYEFTTYVYRDDR